MNHLLVQEEEKELGQEPRFSVLSQYSICYINLPLTSGRSLSEGKPFQALLLSPAINSASQRR